MEFDYEKYPDGISSPLDDLEPSVWDRGYYCETDEGVWYEVYFSEEQKKHYPSEKEIQETFDSNLIDGEGFKGISLWNFEEDNQITFFVPNGEEEWTFDKMTDMFY